mgnify:FL=1
MQLVLPVDVVVARSLNDDVGCCTVPVVVGCCSHDCPCVPEGRDPSNGKCGRMWGHDNDRGRLHCSCCCCSCF